MPAVTATLPLLSTRFPLICNWPSRWGCRALAANLAARKVKPTGPLAFGRTPGRTGAMTYSKKGPLDLAIQGP